MARINKIIKVLKNKGVKDYRLIETEQASYQQFYDLEKLETARIVKTIEDKVTVYVKKDNVIGEASFIVSHEESKTNLEKLIDQALYEASFVKNETYDLVKGDKKKSMAYKPLEEKPFAILTKIAKIFFSKSNKEARFNALELFFDEESTHLINSNGVDYKKKIFQISVEAIPSFYGEDDFKTELYRMFRYSEVNYDLIDEDAKRAISDVYNRGKAVKLENLNKCNIILREDDLSNLLYEIVDNLNYANVYNHSNLKSIGEAITTNKINISLDAKNKYDYFDNDGVKLKKCNLIENGVVKSYFGNNRYANYLKVEATGDLEKIVVSKGNKSVEEFKTKPYLEIYDMSGIQVDAYQDYLGGEVRLALYNDGKNIIPVSGFSFSIELSKAMDSLKLSKELANKKYYNGPKYALIKDATIN